MSEAVLIRTGSRRNTAGFLVTLALHGAVIGGFALARARRHEEPLQIPRDFVMAEMVKLGKPRDKFWLPRIPTPPRPKAPPPQIKLSDDPNAAAAPAEAPRPEDADLSKDTKRALERARALAKAAVEEEAEGSPTGSEEGTANTAKAGDEYATAVGAAIRKNWSVPSQLVGDAEADRLEAIVRVRVAADGALLEPLLSRPSGNEYFDDSCVQAVKATAKVPPPPPALQKLAARGFNIACGKGAGR